MLWENLGSTPGLICVGPYPNANILSAYEVYLPETLIPLDVTFMDPYGNSDFSMKNKQLIKTKSC